MEGLKIYYLENQKDDFTLLKDELNEKGLIVYPKSLKTWSDELFLINKYLKANEEEKNNLRPDIITIFKKYDIDLFVLDYYLIETEYTSITIYNDILKKDPKLSTAPIIFLTIEDKDELFPINSNTGFVLKKSNLSEKNVNETFTLLIKEIEKFPILLEKRIDKKNINSQRVNWLRKNF